MPNLAFCPCGGEESPTDFMPTAIVSLLRKLNSLTGSSDRKGRSGIHLERGLGISQMPSPSEGPLGREGRTDIFFLISSGNNLRKPGQMRMRREVTARNKAEAPRSLQTRHGADGDMLSLFFSAAGSKAQGST